MRRIKTVSKFLIENTWIPNRVSYSSECPYCGTSYSSCGSFPQTTLTYIVNPHWEPRIITTIHDVRQEFKCVNCGASFKFKQKEETVKKQNRFMTEGVGPM